MNAPCRVVIAGATNIDRMGWLKEPFALGCSNPGHFEETPGGTAFNVAAVIAALGAKPEVVSLVGDDSNGTVLREHFREHGIQFHTGGKTRAKTGTYTCLIEPDGSLLVGLADMAIYEDFKADMATGAVNSLQSSDWFCVDTNLPTSAVSQLLRATPARKVGLTVSKAKAAKLGENIGLLDIIFTNRLEFCSLCGISENSGDGTVISALHALNVENVIISNGEKAVMVMEGSVVSTLPVQPVSQVEDVTGAGDALVGATLFSLMEGGNLINSVEFGISAAHATIQSKGPIRPDLADEIHKPAITRR